MRNDTNLSPEELNILKKLNSPIKIQNFLDALPFNHEKGGETHRSVRRVLRDKTAHCIEGALLAACALEVQGEDPLLLDLVAHEPDDDHVVALYIKNGHWGAISKTNHATIRFRDPVYKTVRELALSYFHEWFMNSNGKKTLKSYSAPLKLKKAKGNWVTAEEDIWWLDSELNRQKHFNLVPQGNRTYIRDADPMELKAGRLVEWEPDT